MPTHHLHISTGFMFMTALFVVAFVAVIFAFVRSMRNDRLAAEVAVAEAKAQEKLAEVRRQEYAGYAAKPTSAEVDAFMPRSAPNMRPASIHNGYPVAQQVHSQGYVPNTYAPVAPVYAHDPLTGLETGMLIGSALSHSHDHTTTIIHDSAPSYVDSGPSYSSSSSDSGFSYSDSSSSYSSDSSGGFDASW
jgi:hypothetical protein